METSHDLKMTRHIKMIVHILFQNNSHTNNSSIVDHPLRARSFHKIHNPVGHPDDCTANESLSLTRSHCGTGVPGITAASGNQSIMT